jgi:hypothetical protein
MLNKLKLDTLSADANLYATVLQTENSEENQC